MEASFQIPIKTFSINEKSTRNASYTTQKYKDWAAKALYQLDKPSVKEELKKIREYLNIEKHIIEVELIAYYPKDVVFTKKDLPSSRCHDITNWEKILVDLMFLPNYHDRKVPYGCQNLNIDDKYLFDCISRKRISTEHKIEVTIKVHHKQDIFPEYFQNKEQFSCDDTEEL